MELIEQIRQAASIIDLASQYTTLRKRGKKYVGLCPFHSEKTPSFTLDEDKQLYHCFGCGAGGDVFTLIIEKENMSFPEAVQYLAEKYRIPLPQKKKLSSHFSELEEKLYPVNENALVFFKKNLYNTQEGKQALHYLKKRGISEEFVQTLKIGYAMNSWDSLLTYFRGKNISAELLTRAGLALQRPKKEGYYDRFRGRIIFPIFSLTGKVVAFGGRTLFDAEPKYLNSPDTPVYTKGEVLYGLNFTKESVHEKGELILVEGYTDFLALFAAGITNCAASLGTSLTVNQIALARRFAPRMIVCYDGDEAGQKAASRAVPLCFEKDVEVKVLTLPKEDDPDSFLQKYGVEQLKNIIPKSHPGLKFLIDFHQQAQKVRSPEEKARVAKSVMDDIEKIPDIVARSEYIKQASDYLSIDERVLRTLSRQKPSEKPDEEKSLFLPAEKRLFQILWQDALIAPYVVAEMGEEDFKDLMGESVLNYILACFRQKKEPQFHELKEKISPSLFSAFSEALQEKGEPPSVEEALDCLRALRQFSLEKLSKDLALQIARSERNGENDRVRALLSQRLDIARQLSNLTQQNAPNMGSNKREVVPE